MARLEPLDLDNLSAEQKIVADAIIAGPRGGLRGPFEPWLRSPGLADTAQRVGAHCRYGTSLPADISELTILLTGRHWKAQFEFWAHARLAKEAGLAEDIIEAIRTGQPPPFTRDIERAVFDVVGEYFSEHRVSDATYATAVSVLGEKGLVDVVGIVGYYGLVSMTLNVFEIGVPEGVEDPLL